MMSAQEVSILMVKANEQGPELIYPGETTFSGEAALIRFLPYPELMSLCAYFDIPSLIYQSTVFFRPWRNVVFASN